MKAPGEKEMQLQSLLDIIADNDSEESDVYQAIDDLIELSDARALIHLEELSARRHQFQEKVRDARKSIRHAWLETSIDDLKKKPFKHLDPVERIIRKLFSWWGGLRFHMVRALGHVNDERALPYLLILALYGIPASRVIAVHGLGRLKHGGAVPTLVAILSHRNKRVARAAAWALEQIGSDAVEPLIHFIANDKTRTRVLAVNVLDKIDDERAIPCLLQCLKDGTLFTGNIKEHAKNALLDFKEKAFQPLMDALKGDDMLLRREVVDVVKCIDDSRFRRQLLTMTEDPDGGVRSKVIEVLTKNGGMVMPDVLIRAMSDGREKVRLAASGALKGSPGPEALDVLVLGLKDDSQTIRANCVEALGNLRDKRAAPPLVDLLWDSDRTVREKSVEALAKIDEPAIFETLDQRVDGKNATLESLEALAAWGNTRIIPLLEEWERKDFRQEISHRVNKAVKRILAQTKYIARRFYCIKCFSWSEKYYCFAGTGSFWTLGNKYNACRQCYGNKHLESHIKRVQLILDRGMQDPFVRDGEVLKLNGLKMDGLCDMDEFRIIDANDIDVERWVMKLKNDSDEERLMQLDQITVLLSRQCELSQSKENLLRDNFKVILLNA